MRYGIEAIPCKAESPARFTGQRPNYPPPFIANYEFYVLLCRVGTRGIYIFVIVALIRVLRGVKLIN